MARRLWLSNNVHSTYKHLNTIMKKNYIAPSVEITNVALQQMIAGSDGFKTNMDGLGGYGGVDEDGTKDPSSRRRRNIWEDDEDF